MNSSIPRKSQADQCLLTLPRVVCAGVCLLFTILLCNLAGVPGVAWASDLSQCTVEVKDATYTGSPIRPKLSVTCDGEKLTHGSDYLLVWRHNVNAGVAWVTVKGAGKYSGRKTAFFTIARAKTADVKVRGLEKSYELIGKAITPSVEVLFNGRQMKEGLDYSLSYENNTEVGAACVRIRGMRNLVGDKTVEFAIVSSKEDSDKSVAAKVDIAKCEISGLGAQAYTGKAITPTPKVGYQGKGLVKDSDFTLSYKNNKNLGTASITIRGKGNFTGEKTVTFKIAGNAGARIAAAAVALAGGWSSDNRAPGPTGNGKKGGWSDAQTAPPNTKTWRKQKWDWTLYKKVYAKVNKIRPGHRIHHACCDCLPVLAVLWAGVDDNYLGNKWPTVARERDYLAKSGKWTRVGGSDGYWHTNGGKGYGTGGVKSLQPGDILITLPNKHKHVMIYVGHEAAAKRWGNSTKVELVDEGYGCRWSNGKPMSSRGKCTWRVYRFTGSFNPSGSKYAGIYESELTKYLVL